MTTIDDWARYYGISQQAVTNLRQILSHVDYCEPGVAGKSEASAQRSVRLDAATKGVLMFRNNVGATKTEGGGFIRYGLANDTATLNAACKSSDLIGIKPVLITPAHVGTTIGQFCAREVKKPSWKYTGTEREKAQLKFIEIITAKGGDAKFTIGIF